jgi:hypothetical protein
MVDSDKIDQILKRDFVIYGTYTIDDQGVVNVQGGVDHKAKQSRLYVTFGSVTGHFSSYWRGLKNLKGVPTHIGGTMTITYYPGMPVLRCLAAEHQINLQATSHQPPGYMTEISHINKILDKYVGQGKPGALACAVELIKAGYKENARW